MNAKDFILENDEEAREAVFNGYDLRMSELELLEWMEKYAQYKAENLHISGVRLPLLEQAKDCLMELCQLKAYKDDMGKDAHYQKRQPELWKEANRLLNEVTSKEA